MSRKGREWRSKAPTEPREVKEGKQNGRKPESAATQQCSGGWRMHRSVSGLAGAPSRQTTFPCWQFVYPMLMFMGAKKHKIGGMGASPMLAGCVQTCQAQLGCGNLPDGSESSTPEEKK